MRVGRRVELVEHGSYANSRCISGNAEVTREVWLSERGAQGDKGLQAQEGLLARWGPLRFEVVLGMNGGQRCGETGHVGDELAQVVDESEEALQLLDRGRHWPFCQIGQTSRIDRA